MGRYDVSKPTCLGWRGKTTEGEGAEGETHEIVFIRNKTGNKTGGNRGCDLVGHRRTTGIDADHLPGRPAE